MTAPEFPNVEKLPDREKLVGFVNWVRAFLDYLVASGEHHDFFYARPWELVKPAWEEVQPEFGNLVEAVNEIPDDRIISHGLSGFQLRFKLSTIRELFRVFKRPSKRGLRRLLEGIDTLLDSIVSAVGGHSAVQEIKDMIRNCVKAEVEA